MGHGCLHCRRDIDDRLPPGSGLPHIQNRVAYVKRILDFRAVETLRTVFEHEIAFCLIGQFLEKLRSVHRELFDLLFVLPKHLLALRHRCGIIEMHNSLRRSAYGFESFSDNVLSRLCQYLDRHIVRDHISLNKGTQESILRLGSCGESHFDLFESDLYQHPEEFDLLFKAHRLDQSLISVAQVNTAPDGSLIDVIFLRPVEALRRRKKILPHVLTEIHHCCNHSFHCPLRAPQSRSACRLPVLAAPFGFKIYQMT